MIRVIVTVVDDEAGSVHVYEGKFDEGVKIIAVEDVREEPEYDDVKEVFGGSEWNYMEAATTELWHEDFLKPGHIDRNQGS